MLQHGEYVRLSRNMLATDIAERKLLEILEDELLGLDSGYEYQMKNASDWDSVQSFCQKTGYGIVGQYNK